MNGYVGPMDILHKDITAKIISSFYKVYNTLGYGFLERVYEKSMVIELTTIGLDCKTQVPLKVYYRGSEVGCYYADLIVNSKIIIELKAVESITAIHETQLLNYLKATNIELGLLLNFGPTPTFKRKIFNLRTEKNKEVSDFQVEP